ncbi:MAG: MBL fold metallo-hydrolase [Firmicutes bacterium]|nr:MBL fold metallo-hydrolase [Bacillota bacterium]
MAKLLYQGHGSFRVESEAGTVIYFDPYAGEGYDKPAHFILITHQHSDHNQVAMVPKTSNCRVITWEDALAGGEQQTLTLEHGSDTLVVEAVEAGNENHDPSQCVGYILTIDDVSIYGAGDTSRTGEMETMRTRKLDYALLPADGVYNMDLDEAMECALVIGARHTIPIHLKPGALFSRERAEKFNVPGRLILEPGQEITL